MKITKKHLVGDISDFPIEIVEKMVSEQVKQGNLPNPTIFALKKTASYCEGGFTWDATKDSHYFWEDVIRRKNFDVFFSKYPKTSKVESNTTKLVYAVGDYKNRRKVISTLIEHGGVNKLNLTGDCDTWIYYIEPNTNIIRVCDMHKDTHTQLYEVIVALYTQLEIDTTVEVSMEDIAKMMGVNVSDLRIKK